MNLTTLTAISPIDGRYRRVTKDLGNYFSEFALIKYRVFVEIEYFIALCELPLPQLSDFDKTKFSNIRSIFDGFSLLIDGSVIFTELLIGNLLIPLL